MEVFIMDNGGSRDRVYGTVRRDDGENLHVRMANGSEAILPKAQILERGDVDTDENS